MSKIVDSIFSVIFSTPLAIYFFSIFNYFTLSSLYVLLNISIPDVVFEYLALLSKAYQADIFSLCRTSFEIQPISTERVN